MSYVQDVIVEQFTFAISSPDELLVCTTYLVTFRTSVGVSTFTELLHAPMQCSVGYIRAKPNYGVTDCIILYETDTMVGQSFR